MTTGNDLSNEARRLNHVNSTGVLPNRDAGVPIRQSQQSNAVRQFILFHQRHRFLTSATLLSALLHLLVLGCLGLMIFKAPSLVENLLNTILERDSMGIDEG